MYPLPTSFQDPALLWHRYYLLFTFASGVKPKLICKQKYFYSSLEGSLNVELLKNSSLSIAIAMIQLSALRSNLKIVCH